MNINKWLSWDGKVPSFSEEINIYIYLFLHYMYIYVHIFYTICWNTNV